MEINYEKNGKDLIQGLEKTAGATLKLGGTAGKIALKTAGKCAEKVWTGYCSMEPEKRRAIAAAAVGAVALPLFLTGPGVLTKKQKAPLIDRNYAHRGLHSKDKSVPENSLKAFELASAAGYGMELDVQLSKDGQVVVFHDDTLNRVCGVDAAVCDKTLAELQQLSLESTDQRIPLFTEVLAVVDGRGPLIVELKTGKRNRELCEKTLAILREYKGEYCIESFNPFIVAWFRFHAHDIVRGQLAMPAKEYESQTPFRRFVLANVGFNFLARPQFIAYEIGKTAPGAKLACRLGAMNVCWTSHDVRDAKKRDVVIFEFYRPRIKIR